MSNEDLQYISFFEKDPVRGLDAEAIAVFDAFVDAFFQTGDVIKAGILIGFSKENASKYAYEIYNQTYVQRKIIEIRNNTKEPSQDEIIKDKNLVLYALRRGTLSEDLEISIKSAKMLADVHGMGKEQEVDQNEKLIGLFTQVMGELPN